MSPGADLSGNANANNGHHITREWQKMCNLNVTQRVSALFGNHARRSNSNHNSQPNFAAIINCFFMYEAEREAASSIDINLWQLIAHTWWSPAKGTWASFTSISFAIYATRQDKSLNYAISSLIKCFCANLCRSSSRTDHFDSWKTWEAVIPTHL